MLHVVKANGDTEGFQEEKVLHSIKRAGIPDSLAPQVLQHVTSKLYDNMPTSEVYRHIVEFLGASQSPYARAKYSLKQALKEFGPTGYPFEDFVAKIFQAQGSQTQIRTIIRGTCVSHEIDVIAKEKSSGKTTMIEAKFHNGEGIQTDLHVSLYTKARFDDVKEKNHFDQALLITNTKATSDAVTYAMCSGLHIISWEYPQGNSLRDLIEKYNIHPLTSLTSLSQNQKQQLLQKDIVLCSDISKNHAVLDILQLSKEQKEQVIAEASFVSNQSLS